MPIHTLTRVEITNLGESQTLEFKRSLSLLKEAFSDLCAMVNADSARGVVLFGVEPSSEVCGLGDTNLDSAQKTLALHCQQKVDPPLTIEIRPYLCEGKTVIALTGIRSKAVPFHEYDGRAYIRSGSISLKVSVAQKQHLTLSRSRDLHSGPWRCDRCGAIAGAISIIEISDQGVRKSYGHNCGGEYWPAA